CASLDARLQPPMCPAAVCRCTTISLSFLDPRGSPRSGRQRPDVRDSDGTGGRRGMFMSAAFDDQALLEPISADQPCGQNLDEAPVLPGEQTAILSDLDGLRLFGQSRSPEAPPDPEDREREQAKARAPIEWDRIRRQTLDGLARSKDLRLLAYLGTALLRTDGLAAFASTVTTAAQWGETFWPQV